MLPSKRALRAYAASHPAAPVPPGHGLLTASQVTHVIRAAAHVIDHKRVLVLYIYSKQDILSGVPEPAFTAFMTRTDCVTLRRSPASGWRLSPLDRLLGWNWDKSCAFCSLQDERRVQAYLRGPLPGLEAVVRAQHAIRDARALARRQAKDMAVLAAMRPFGALPRGLPGWVRRSVMPAYFRCLHASSRHAVTGVCTACGHEFTLPSASHGKGAACPCCGRDLIIKSAAMGRYEDRATVQALERVDAYTIAVRVAKAVYRYGKDALLPSVSLYENARVLVRMAPGGAPEVLPYYLSYGSQDGRPTPWRTGYRSCILLYIPLLGSHHSK